VCGSEVARSFLKSSIKMPSSLRQCFENSYQSDSKRFSLNSFLWLLALLLIGLLAAWPIAAHAQRVALVVGNAAYTDRPLRNPVNDAALMQTTLSNLGFQVSVLRNADRKALLAGLRDFEAKARNADVALFFYAGHGAQVGGSNYLIPLNAQINAEADVPDEAVDAASVLRRIEDARAKVGLVILDACRDNPYTGSTRSGARGLARMNVPTGTIVAYATAPGSTADDGTGRSNGIYTEQLARHLAQPGLDIKDVFDRTAQEVERITSGKQRPREEIGLRGRYVLKEGGSPQQVVARARVEPVTPLTIEQIETQDWEAAQRANSAAAYNGYLQKFPRGRYASVAKGAVARLLPVPVLRPSNQTRVADSLSGPSSTSESTPLVFKARGESWVEVTDARGVVTLRRTLTVGDTVVAAGVLPLNVVIGRASVIDVEVRGKSFDLASVVRDDIARFEVK
jgi:hypothetical protein